VFVAMYVDGHGPARLDVCDAVGELYAHGIVKRDDPWIGSGLTLSPRASIRIRHRIDGRLTRLPKRRAISSLVTP
jgi:hypothetical protein